MKFNTKLILKISLIVMLIITFNINSIVCLASEGNSNFDFNKFENQSADTTVKQPIEDAIGAILSVVRIVGTGIAIIIILVIAMKYLIASPGDRADFKKAAIQYVVGAIILFGSVNLLDILVKTIPNLLPS